MPLDPEIAAYLESQKNEPSRSSLTVDQTRERMRRAATLAGPPPLLPRTEDLILQAAIRARQYWPAIDAEQPLVIYFHGGRFFSGDLETHDAVCRSLAVASQCRVVAVDYRLGPEHRFPCAFEDARQAVAWALEQRVPLAVAGDSAGANLAAGVAIADRAPALKCQLLIYPMIDATCTMPSYAEFADGYGPGALDMKRGWNQYLPAGADLRDPRVSPLFASDLGGVAPAHVMTAEYDPLRDEGEAYARKLAEVGVPVACRRYDGAIHGFFTMAGILRQAREAVADAGAFLRGHLYPCLHGLRD